MMQIDQGAAKKQEDIASTLKELGVLNDSTLTFEYVVVGECLPWVWRWR